MRGYCAAVRASLTDDGLPPLAASGLLLHERLGRIADSLDRVAARAGSLPGGRKLRRLRRRGLEETAALWPEVQAAYRWVKQVARVLKNPTRQGAAAVRRQLAGLLGAMRQAAAKAGETLRAQLLRFMKVTRSYWPGLFVCYDRAGVPRTNNDLEHLFGSHRYHERRASGRRRGTPGLVVSGSVRVVSSLATRLRPEEGLRLAEGYVEGWRQTREALDKRREGRRRQRRFRHDPATYLKQLEDMCLQPGLLL